MHFACHTFALFLLPYTMEKSSLMFPHRNMESLSPVTSQPKIVTMAQATLSLGPGLQVGDYQNLSTSGISIKYTTTSPSLFSLYQTLSIQTKPPYSPSVNFLPPISIQAHSTSQPTVNLLPPISIQTNLSLPVGSTARLHCRVSNVEQEQVISPRVFPS